MHRRFNVSLAHLQSSVVDLVRGLHSRRASYDRFFPNPDAIKEAYSSVEFRIVGWKNINFVEFTLFSSFLLIVWILTIRYKERIILEWLFDCLMALQAPRVREIPDW